MADAASKLTFFFEAIGKTACVGWTETFYSSLPMPASKEALIQQGKDYAKKRHSLLGIGAMMQAVRVAAVNNPKAGGIAKRQTAIYFFTEKEGSADLFRNQDQDDFDPAQVDLLVRVEDQDGDKRQLWIGGLPDSVTHQLVQQGIDGQFINSPVFKQTMAQIQTNNWGLRVLDKPKGDPPTYSFKPITFTQPIMVRNRKRGRPFFLFRGRVPA